MSRIVVHARRIAWEFHNRAVPLAYHNVPNETNLRICNHISGGITGRFKLIGSKLVDTTDISVEVIDNDDCDSDFLRDPILNFRAIEAMTMGRGLTLDIDP